MRSVTLHSSTFSYDYVRGAEELKKFLSGNPFKDEILSIDIETYERYKYRGDEDAPLVPEKAKIRTIQAFDGKTCAIMDFMELDGSYSLLDTELVKLLNELLLSKILVAHNAIFETSHLQKLFTAHFGKIKPLNIYCTMNAYRLIVTASTENTAGIKNTLEALCKDILDLEIEKEMQSSDWWVSELSEEQLKYCAIDAITPWYIFESLYESIERLEMTKVYTINTLAQEAVAHMRIHGMCIDTKKHDELIEEWKKETEKRYDEIKHEYGIENPASTKQRSEWLRNYLSEEELKDWPVNEKSGYLRVDRETLKEFEHIPIAKKLSDYNYYAKLYSTYGVGFKKHIVEKDNANLIYSNFTLCKTYTGRMSSYEPNFQNLPRDKEIRSLFIPRAGNRKLICADFSQVELRVAAALSKDTTMCEAYEADKDLHQLTAAAFAQKDFNSVTKDERQAAKSINFGLIFGAGAVTLQKYSKKVYGIILSEEEALKAVMTFRDTYPEFRMWQLNQAHEAESTGFIRTPLGKLRKLDEDKFYTTSMNTPVQGGAGEVMLLAIYKIWEFIQTTNIDAYLVNVVHDEVIVDCLDEDVEDMRTAIEHCMCEAFREVFPNGCTLKLVQAQVGNNWAEAK